MSVVFSSGGKIKHMTFLEGSYKLASASDSGSIFVYE